MFTSLDLSQARTTFLQFLLDQGATSFLDLYGSDEFYCPAFNSVLEQAITSCGFCWLETDEEASYWERLHFLWEHKCSELNIGNFNLIDTLGDIEDLRYDMEALILQNMFEVSREPVTPNTIGIDTRPTIFSSSLESMIKAISKVFMEEESIGVKFDKKSFVHLVMKFSEGQANPSEVELMVNKIMRERYGNQ